jgi:hypothetical protein
MKEWQSENAGNHADRQEQWRDYVRHTREMTGDDPRIRKSLDALISEPIKSITWDYLQLQDMHKVRRGIWTKAQAAE